MEGIALEQPSIVARAEAPVARRFDLTVLLPAYNEEAAIEPVLAEVVAALEDEPLRFEIVVVDDASQDRTAELAERFAAGCRRCPVRVVRRAENGGAGAARKTGVREARGDVVVMLDADGTYPAAAIRDLLRHFPDYDQVNGARTSEQGTWPLLRAPVKWLIRRFAARLTGREIPDLNTGLKAFKREAMLRWLWAVPDGFSCVTTMTLTFLNNGYAVKYVPTQYRRRIGRSKFHPLADTMAYLATIVRVTSYFRPLRVFLPAAAIAVGLGMLRGAWSWAASGSIGDGCISLMAAGLATGMFGLLAEIVAARHRR